MKLKQLVEETNTKDLVNFKQKVQELIQEKTNTLWQENIDEDINEYLIELVSRTLKEYFKNPENVEKCKKLITAEIKKSIPKLTKTFISDMVEFEY